MFDMDLRPGETVDDKAVKLDQVRWQKLGNEHVPHLLYQEGLFISLFPPAQLH